MAKEDGNTISNREVKNRVLVISEHQSTINENMPLRDLLYLGRTLEKLLDKRTIYKRKLVGIPTPEFFVILSRYRDKNTYSDICIIPMFLQASFYAA